MESNKLLKKKKIEVGYNRSASNLCEERQVSLNQY